MAQGMAAPILVFEDRTGREIDFDLRGSKAQVLGRLSLHPLFAAVTPAEKGRSGPGRPKLGVTSREVSLLPRHWAFLEQQPTGASAALRRLVEQALKENPQLERARLAREAAGRFMTTMAGNLPGFEEALRALYAKDHRRLETLIAGWPRDIRRHLTKLVEVATPLVPKPSAG